AVGSSKASTSAIVWAEPAGVSSGSPYASRSRWGVWKPANGFELLWAGRAAPSVVAFGWAIAALPISRRIARHLAWPGPTGVLHECRDGSASAGEVRTRRRRRGTTSAAQRNDPPRARRAALRCR